MRTLRLSLLVTVMLALLGGPGGVALAQDDAGEPMTPAFFTMVEETEDPWTIVTTDPRFSGTWVAREPLDYFLGANDWDHVCSGFVHLENDDGAWKGWTSGLSWMGKVPHHEQMWLVGEGAYEGLAAVMVDSCEQLPCKGEDSSIMGIIWEGEVPPLWANAE